jgi:hypothetical protein
MDNNSQIRSLSNTFTSASAPTSASTSSSFFSPSTWTWKMWVIIIIVLALFGINIFFILAKGTQSVANFLNIFLGIFGNAAINTTKDVVKGVDTVATTGINATSGAIVTGLNDLQQLPGQIQAQTQGTTLSNTTTPSQPYNNLNNTLNNKQDNHPDNPTYVADEASSSIQKSKGSEKAGWCYIGEEKGYSSCIYVNESDQCMSGDIFPSKDVCVNHHLRY